MINLWGEFAKVWRSKRPKIDKEKLEVNLGENLDQVQTIIQQSKSVPTALDEIFSDDDDDDDW